MSDEVSKDCITPSRSTLNFREYLDKSEDPFRFPINNKDIPSDPKFCSPPTPISLISELRPFHSSFLFCGYESFVFHSVSRLSLLYKLDGPSPKSSGSFPPLTIFFGG